MHVLQPVYYPALTCMFRKIAGFSQFGLPFATADAMQVRLAVCVRLVRLHGGEISKSRRHLADERSGGFCVSLSCFSCVGYVAESQDVQGCVLFFRDLASFSG